MKKILVLLAALLLPSFAFAGNQSAVVTALAKQSGMSEELAHKQLDQVVAAIRSELVEGRDVTIPNFGKFYVSEQKARTGRNPKTGQSIEIAAKRYPRFVSADGFKAAMNPKTVQSASVGAKVQG